jgi:hypothetical protein
VNLLKAMELIDEEMEPTVNNDEEQLELSNDVVDIIEAVRAMSRKIDYVKTRENPKKPDDCPGGKTNEKTK